MASTSQDVVVVNDLGTSSLSSRTRTNASGGESVRYTVELQAEPILHDFNQEALGQGPAEAIRALLERKIKELKVAASPATGHRRANASVGLAAGNPSDVARYSGGKTGTKPPNLETPPRLFNDSGRLAEGLAVRFNPTSDNFTINVTANRLDPRTFRGGQAGIVAMWQRLVALVPEFKGGLDVLKHEEVRNAIGEAVADSIVTRTDRARSTISRARQQLFGAVLRDLTKIVQLGG